MRVTPICERFTHTHSLAGPRLLQKFAQTGLRTLHCHFVYKAMGLIYLNVNLEENSSGNYFGGDLVKGTVGVGISGSSKKARGGYNYY